MVHDGFKNTHSFLKDGMQITLAPMKPEFVGEGSKGVGNVTHGFTSGEISRE